MPGAARSGLAGWWQRAQARQMERARRVYEPLVQERKRRLLGPLRGTVLEIGPGTGANIAYYAADVQWIGVEPNLHMHAYLHAAAARQGLAIDLREGVAEELPADDGSVDVVVSTLVLCSVSDVARALGEVRRVLRPGGRLVFVEHVAAPAGTGLRALQNLLQPLWTPLVAGCHPNRETWRAIERAGFAAVQLEQFQLPTGPTSPHIAGIAAPER